MYTMVLMMAASSAGDTADFGFRKGNGSCTGAIVATAPVATGCCTPAPVVYAAPVGCTGPVVASGSCTGRSGLFGGGLLKNHKWFGGRSNGCTGTVIAAPSYGYGGGCVGSVPATWAGPVGCEPTLGTVGNPITGTPVVMPPVTPKKDEPKKDEPKKTGNES